MKKPTSKRAKIFMSVWSVLTLCVFCFSSSYSISKLHVTVAGIIAVHMSIKKHAKHLLMDLASSNTLLHVEAEFNYVAILHNVVLTLQTY